MLPFLEETHDRLAALVKEDMSFLSHERQRRLERVRQALDDPLVSTGEKFRKVMEAVSIEAEYGNTIEVYREEILLEGKKIQADIFRLGRISLFFQTLDRKTTGYLDPATLSFTRFPSEYNRQIGAAMEMGGQTTAHGPSGSPLGKVGDEMKSVVHIVGHGLSGPPALCRNGRRRGHEGPADGSQGEKGAVA